LLDAAELFRYQPGLVKSPEAATDPPRRGLPSPLVQPTDAQAAN
jgi:hypothetical protein